MKTGWKWGGGQAVLSSRKLTGRQFSSIPPWYFSSLSIFLEHFKTLLMQRVLYILKSVCRTQSIDTSNLTYSQIAGEMQSCVQWYTATYSHMHAHPPPHPGFFFLFLSPTARLLVHTASHKLSLLLTWTTWVPNQICATRDVNRDLTVINIEVQLITCHSKYKYACKIMLKYYKQQTRVNSSGARPCSCFRKKSSL